jgi:CRISP-associated protein Cas1
MSRARPDLPELPGVVPARMVNEFVYCPRLFYLEWVQGRFATSDDVEEGLYVHRVVDQPAGLLPDPEDDLERFAGRTARSLWLSSADLGISAKVDMVEVGDRGTVTPVDFKKGAPDRQGRAWPSDEIQSVLQALLLQEAGYTVEQAEIWYATARRRAVVHLDEARLRDIRGLLARLWQIAAQDQAPPPLVDSPKCPGCSLVGLCLPDEINALESATAPQSDPAASWPLIRTTGQCTSSSRVPSSARVAAAWRLSRNGTSLLATASSTSASSASTATSPSLRR